MDIVQEFLQVVEKLHSQDGCDWDKQQTFQTMKQHLLEEANEVAVAIDNNDISELQEELGDLFLNILHICEIAKQKELFDFNAVVDGIKAKMIRRHPHVFGNMKFNTMEELMVHWNKVKEEEKLEKVKRKGEING